MGRLEREMVKREHIDRMKFMRQEIEKAILPYRQNTEAALVAAAAVQVARTLLDLYPPKKREQLIEGVIAFLKHENLEAATDSGIIIPKGIM